MSYNDLLSNSDLAKSFSTLTDPRVKRTQKHNMMDIIFITVCAVICGADQWTEIEEFGHAKYDWFVSFLELPNGIPSHDTFNRLFSILNPEEFKKCFIHWINSIKDKNIKNTIIPIDGKTVRGSFDKNSSKSAIHIVSAWCSENNIVLGQIKTEEKSNEITAIPELLNLIDITDSIITIDAMGCQKAIAAKITALQGDYILSLKGNQNNLFNKVIDFFAFSIDVTPVEEISKLVTLTEEEYKAITELDNKKDKTELEIAKKEILDDPSLLYGYEKNAVINSYYEYADTNNHGRKEVRKYHIASNLLWIEEESINWHNLQTMDSRINNSYSF